MLNRQAIVAAGIYNDPIDYLNQAVALYSDLVQFYIDSEEKIAASSVKSNAELFEEWKRLFGKIEENSTPEQ